LPYASGKILSTGTASFAQQPKVNERGTRVGECNAKDAAEPRAPRRAVRLRDAATLILVDRSAGANRVLMGRRSAGHSFLPGKWVFPGGQIARQDFGAPAASDLHPGAVQAMSPDLSERRARALAVAAVRETFEETGLLLAAPASGLTPSTLWRDFCAGGVAPDLASLSLIARMITPPDMPKRFDTRFFIAEADRLLDRQPADSRELEELRWFTLDDAQGLELMRPTKLVLEDLGHRLAGVERPLLFHRFKRRV
jgi:8-oxo-dGTP pyrophosphatase MutT (NUDIX family)